MFVYKIMCIVMYITSKYNLNTLSKCPREMHPASRPINEQLFYPSHKETCSLMKFGKIGGPH